MRKRRKKVDRTANLTDNATLLARRDVEGKGLYELVKLESGAHIIRVTRKDGVRQVNVSRARALQIAKAEDKAREARLRKSLHPKLLSGLGLFEGEVRCDTKTDKLLDVIVRDDENMVAMYRDADGHTYFHAIDHNIEYVYNIEITDDIMSLLEFWFCGIPTLRGFLEHHLSEFITDMESPSVFY